MFSLVKYPPDITEPGVGNHRADVRIRLESLDGGSENRSRSKFLGPSHNHIVKLVILGLVDDKFLDADTILTSVLARWNSVKHATVKILEENIQDTTHPDTYVSVQVCAGQDDGRILPSQFQSQWGHVVCSGKRDLATDFLRPNKGDVLNNR